jgi:hypothetical protein
MGSIFGSGTQSKVSGGPWDMIKKYGKSTGLTRDGSDMEAEANSLAGEFPGTQTGYDNTRPLAGSKTGYQHHQAAYQGSYASDGYQGNNNYDGQPSYQQPYGQTYAAQQPGSYAAPGHQEPPPPAQQYGYDSNASLQQHYHGGYRYGEPPPGQGGGYYQGRQY